MANATERRVSRVLGRIRKALTTGLISDAPDQLVTPVLDALVVLGRAKAPMETELERAGRAITELERWGEKCGLPAYKNNDYARTWTRILNAS
jgi:hypothetical protein